jgi:hypothetical protein
VAVDDNGLVWLGILQHGAISRSQALGLGISVRSLQHRIRPGGPWQRLLPGVYLTFTGQPTALQLETAAMLYAGADSFVTGPAALRFHEIRCPAAHAVDVLIPAGRQRANCAYVVPHRTRRMPVKWVQDRATRYVLPSRAVADTVRGLRSESDARAIVASAVQQRRCTVDHLAAELRDGHHAGGALLRSVLAEVADGIRSSPEGDLRRLIVTAGLPKPLFNPRLYLGADFLAVPDAWWPQASVAVEVDSREWHLSPEDWERTMRRDRRMRAAGINVLHVSPRQLREEPGQVLADIAAALRTGTPSRGITARPA